MALVLSTALVGYALRGGINLFRTPSELLAGPPAPDEVFRVGGLVEEGSLVEGDGTEIRFSVTDRAASVPVVYAGIRPDLFGEGQGVIARGSWTDGRFVADEILAKHDESYMPKEVVDALKKQGVFVPTPGG